MQNNKLKSILYKEVVNSALLFRWVLLLLGIASFYSWFTSFPLQDPLPYTDIIFNGFYLLAVLIGLVFVLRLRIPSLEVGWSVFGYTVLITFLNEFTVAPKLIGSILPGLFMTFSLVMIVMGLYFSHQRLNEELDRSKQAEANRRESEKKYRDIFEQSRDAIYISTREGRFVDINQTALDLLGYTRAEMLNMSVKKLYLNPDDRSRFIQEMDLVGFVRDFELELQKKDGTEMICLETAAVRRDENGRTIGFNGILRDITDQKRVERELRESEERFRSTIQSIDDLIFTIDLSGTILSYHPSQDEDNTELISKIVNQPLSGIFSSKVVQNLNHAIESLEWGNTKYQFEYSLEENGDESWFSTVATGQYNTDGNLEAVTVVQRDITARQKADAELRNTNAALAEAKVRAENMTHELEKIRDELQFALDAAKEADRMKSEFLANTSHELRTPLNSIIGFLKLVLDGLCDSPDEEQEFLDNALKSSNLLLNLINDVLDIAKIEAGKMELMSEAVDVKELFDEIYTLTHVQTEQKKLFLKTTLPDEQIIVTADQQKLRQVLLNLVGNSVKFTSFGGIEIAAELLPGNQHAKLAVIDTGVGIALDKQDRVFEKFTQADGSTSRKYGGTGLGLTITKSLIELMGGEIALSSEGRGKGTTMSFTIPLNTDEIEETDVMVELE